MKKFTGIAGIASLALLAGCQSSEENVESSNPEPVEQTTDSENAANDPGQEDQPTLEEQEDESEPSEDTGSAEIAEDDETEMKESGSETYGSAQESPGYLIQTHTTHAEVEGINQFFISYSLDRDVDSQMSFDEVIVTALSQEDPSIQNILSTYADVSVDWPNLQIHFEGEESDLSTTTAESRLFYDSLFGISDLYGIEEMLLLNPDGEPDVIVAERGIKEPIVVKDERGLTRGYYTVYDTELEETLFLPGGALEEQVEDQGEPLSFTKTIESMHTVDQADAFYSSAIVDGIEVIDSSLENGVAAVHYSVDENIATEEDQIVFERAIQLAALDFHAWEVRLRNDTTMEIVTYPLVGNG